MSGRISQAYQEASRMLSDRMLQEYESGDSLRTIGKRWGLGASAVWLRIDKAHHGHVTAKRKRRLAIHEHACSQCGHAGHNKRTCGVGR